MCEWEEQQALYCSTHLDTIETQEEGLQRRVLNEADHTAVHMMPAPALTLGCLEYLGNRSFDQLEYIF